MSFEIVTSSYRLRTRRRAPWQVPLRIGLYSGAAAVYLVLVGLFNALEQQSLIEELFPLGQAALAACLVVGCFFATREGRLATRIASGALAGTVAALVFDLLFLLQYVPDIRQVFIVAAPRLFRELNWGLGDPIGAAIAVAAGALIGATTGAVAALPLRPRRAVWSSLIALVAVGAFEEVLIVALQGASALKPLRRLIFAYDALSPIGALLVAVAGAAVAASWPRGGVKTLLPAALQGGPHRRRALIVLLWAALLLSPLIVNAYYAQVLLLIGLYGLMAMGLNVELGFAGLVDLGFVAFYAIGAYTVALLTSNNPLAIADLSFWAALPLAIATAATAGFIFGLPVLRVRGDYLAVATLSLGEIVRVLVSSDALKHTLGGAQGIIEIAKPAGFGLTLGQPWQIYYIVLALIVVAWVVSRNLDRSYIGRAWAAVKGDEDVAQTFGIDLVGYKLLSYTVGAAFAGAGGAVFATMIGSVYPASFQLLISINVLAILVVGGLGSIPGAVLGAAALIGVPELLREFGEFRYLLTGIVLILMMRLRPQGLVRARSPASRA